MTVRKFLEAWLIRRDFTGFIINLEKLIGPISKREDP